MDPIATNPARSPPADTARLREAARKFEAQAFAGLLAPAFATVQPGRGSFGGGAAEEQWRPMLIDAMAQAAVRGGRGIGIADAVLRELVRAQSNATPGEERR